MLGGELRYEKPPRRADWDVVRTLMVGRQAHCGECMTFVLISFPSCCTCCLACCLIYPCTACKSKMRAVVPSKQARPVAAGAGARKAGGQLLASLAACTVLLSHAGPGLARESSPWSNITGLLGGRELQKAREAQESSSPFPSPEETVAEGARRGKEAFESMEEESEGPPVVCGSVLEGPLTHPSISLSRPRAGGQR